jgi:hypothetical protein
VTNGTTLFLILLWAVLAFPSSGLQTAPARPPPQQNSEITESNWEQNPQIKAIREMVAATDAALKNHSFKTSERRFEYCPNVQLTVRRIAQDSKGAAPWYETYSEGQDESWNFHYYYDSGGRLRFVSATARSANGTREELHIYFDENGKRLWKTDKLLKGQGCPGCFSAYYDSDKALAFDPAKDFANDEGCKEIKPNPKVKQSSP